MAGNPINVIFEGDKYYFSASATLDEMSESLMREDPSNKRLVLFSVRSGDQDIIIGDEKLLRAIQASVQGSFLLTAKVKQRGVQSIQRSPSVQQLKSDDVIVDSGEQRIPNVEVLPPAPRSIEVPAVLRYRVGYNGTICEENSVRLRRALHEMSLFEIGQQLIEIQRLSALSVTCYLYNKCGWPLTATIEQMHLIGGDEYLVNGDFIYGILWEERPPKSVSYIDPDTGSEEYCFNYLSYSVVVRLDPGALVFDLRMKVMWKLRIPLQTIKVLNATNTILKLPDDYELTQNDIRNRTIKVKFEPMTTNMCEVGDLFERYDQKETKKLYGYLYVLQHHLAPDTQQALEAAAFLLAEKLDPLLFAFHLALSGASLTKAERVALSFGLRIMHKSFVTFVTSDQSQDCGLMFALLAHVASKLTAGLTELVTITDCAEESEELGRFKISDDPMKEWYLIVALKFCHLTLQLIKVSSAANRFVDYLNAADARPLLSYKQLTDFQKATPYLTLLHPRDITNSTVNRLTYHPSGELWVSKGVKRDSCRSIGLDQDAMLLDILTGIIFELNKTALIDQVQEFLPNEDNGIVVSREPQEAIIVIFDTSRSMSTKYQRDDTNTRLDAAKIFFLLFAQKTMAYDYPHVFSLCTFAESSSFRFDFTENVELFLKLVQELKPSGSRALYNAMQQGVSKLQAIKEKYQNVALRMMILSDGEDNESQVSALTISNLVNQHRIIVDVFAVGGSCALVKMISKRSGGYCYYTDSIIDGMRTFESETILKLSLRKPLPLRFSNIASEEEFDRVAEALPFDTEPPQMMHPPDINSKVCSSVRAFELQMGSQSGNPLVAERVLRELARYNNDPHPDFELFPLSKNLFIWRGIVEGPQGTPYQGGIFDFYMSFGDGYPAKAPEMRFLTPISHPNVTHNGKICHPIFNTAYTTETSVRDILNNVFSLLMTQDFDDYVVSNLSITLSFNKEQFREKAAEWTQRFATRGKSKEQVIKEMMIEDDCPEKYKCALTKRLMRDPVFSPRSEKVFERSAIEAYIQQHGRDPLTSLPLRFDELIADWRLLREINSLYPL